MNWNTTWSNRDGSTLLETVLTMGLMSLVCCCLVSYHLNTKSFLAQLQAQMDVMYAVRTSLQIISDDLHTAVGVDLLDENTELQLHCPNGQIIRYYCRNKQLYRSQVGINGTASVPVAEYITSVQFERLGGLVKIVVGSSKDNAASDVSTSIRMLSLSP